MTNRWVAGAWALAAVHAAVLAAVHVRPGLAAVVLWYAWPPMAALAAAMLLAVALLRTWRRQPTERGHLAALALLAAVVASLALVRTYPSSHDARPSQVRFRLPLDGPVTVAWGGATLAENYHAIMPDQRWAYDLLVTREGRSYHGDGSRVEQYYAYARPVLAPADGTVHAVRDGDPDEPPGRWRLRRTTGNHVVIEVAPREFLFVAHLQPGSITVAPGDRVRMGQPIGRVGNSGNTTEPHVHLHLQDTPRPYLGEAIPFYFHDYRLGDTIVERGMPTGGQHRGVVRGPYTGQIVEHAGGGTGPGREATIIRRVTILDASGAAPIADGEIQIERGLVVFAGAARDAPAIRRATVIDADGRTALPGLIDLHQHAVVAADRPEAWLAHGVTAVRDPGGDLTLGRRLRARIESGTVDAPRLYLGLTIDDGPPQTPAAVRARVAAEAARGLDLVKLYLRTPLDAARAAIGEARRQGLPVTWHLGPTLTEALDLGVDGIEHLYVFRELMPPPDEPPARTTAEAFRQIYGRWARHLDPSDARARALFRRMAARGLVWTPTLALADAIARGESPYSRDWSAADREVGAAGFARACAMVGEAFRHGVRIGAGTDTEAPADLHRELALLVRCGLTPTAALAAATTTAAAALREQGRLGTIAAGAVADLVIVDGRPLERIEDVARVWRVVWRGRVLDPARGPR